MPANPFFSDRNHSRNFGTRRIYPQVQIVNRTKTIIPSNEYAKKERIKSKVFSRLSKLTIDHILLFPLIKISI